MAGTIPSDRRVYEAMWLQALLVRFAVVDVSKYASEAGAGVPVGDPSRPRIRRSKSYWIYKKDLEVRRSAIHHDTFDVLQAPLLRTQARLSLSSRAHPLPLRPTVKKRLAAWCRLLRHETQRVR